MDQELTSSDFHPNEQPKYLQVNVKPNILSNTKVNAPDQSPNFHIRSNETSVDLQKKKPQNHIQVFDQNKME